MSVIPSLLLLIISFVLDITNGTEKAYYASKTPYKPPPSTLVLPSPPSEFELVCAQVVARHGCRALEGRKYDRLTSELWRHAKEDDALTECGERFGEDLRHFISVNDELGFVLIECSLLIYSILHGIDEVNSLNLVTLNFEILLVD